MSSGDAKKEGPSAGGGQGPKKDLKQEPQTPGNNPNQRGGRGGRGGGRGGRGGGFMGQHGGNVRDSPAPGGSRGGGRGGRPHRGGGPGDRGGGHQGGRFEHGGQGGRGFDRITERLQAIQGPTNDLAPMDVTEVKFSGRSRLYVGNLPNDATENSLKEMMSPFGEVGEIFMNSEKKFAFLRMGTRYEAEKAKRELDGKPKNGQVIKVRFAPHQAAVKVQNLSPWVSNELLHRCFSIFGEIERAMVFVDDRGRSKGEGIVEFVRKPSALEAVKRCSDGCFFLTASIRPVIAELDETAEDDDGLQEKTMMKRHQDYQKERETGPRFADRGSFEFEYGAKWKALYDMKKQKLQALDRELKLEEDKLIAQMEFARYEHETENLRAKLREREASRDQQKAQWEAREREMQEMLKLEQERRSREEEAMSSRMQQQDANIRQRQQENSLFMQAQELNSMLDRQEAEMNRGGPPFGGFGPGGNAGPAPFARGGGGGGAGGGGGGNFRGGNDKPFMNAGPGGPGGPGGFGGPGFGGPGPMPFNDGPFMGNNMGGNFGGPMFNNGPGPRGPRRWEGNDDNGPMKRRRF